MSDSEFSCFYEVGMTKVFYDAVSDPEFQEVIKDLLRYYCNIKKSNDNEPSVRVRV